MKKIKDIEEHELFKLPIAFYPDKYAIMKRIGSRLEKMKDDGSGTGVYGYNVQRVDIGQIATGRIIYEDDTVELYM